MGNNWSFLHKGTDQNLQGTLAGLTDFHGPKRQSAPYLMGQKSTAPAFCGKSLYPIFHLEKDCSPLFSLEKETLTPFILCQKMSMPHFFTGQISPSPPCSYTWPGLVPQLWSVSRGLPNIYGSTGPGNAIFWDQITGRSPKYESLKIQVSIQDTRVIASFIEAGGWNDYLDVKEISIIHNS